MSKMLTSTSEKGLESTSLCMSTFIQEREDNFFPPFWLKNKTQEFQGLACQCQLFEGLAIMRILWISLKRRLLRRDLMTSDPLHKEGGKNAEASNIKHNA